MDNQPAAEKAELPEPKPDTAPTEFCELCKEVVEVPHECRLFTAMW